MSDPFDPIKALGEIPASHRGRLRYYPKANQYIINTIQLGVLFVMAWWSGPARVRFSMFKKVLEKLDPDGRLEIVVVDTDGSPDLFETLAFESQFAGTGEIAWIRNGQVIQSSGVGCRQELLEPYTIQLLALTEFT